MTAELMTLRVRSRPQWRAWLEKHHASSPGVWFVFYKAHTGVKSLPYEDTVREALCFGWIDSLVKRLDADRYALKITPRRPTSKWSDINRRRWTELKTAGLLTPAGLAAAPTENKQSNPILRRGAFFRRCREGSAATSSCGSTSRSDPQLANGASANRSPCWRRARSSV